MQSLVELSVDRKVCGSTIVGFLLIYLFIFTMIRLVLQLFENFRNLRILFQYGIEK